MCHAKGPSKSRLIAIGNVFFIQPFNPSPLLISKEKRVLWSNALFIHI
ncbi:hypothetical protein FHX77_000722 [Bifidobacterium commune]|nr:hypothetical protein [Bifidobacterium commune]